MNKEKAVKYYQFVSNFGELFSKDESTKVGAAFLAPDSLEIRSMGYNGFARGVNECDSERWKRPTKYLYINHAEENAIINAARNGTPLNGSICVVSHFPCARCARMIIQSGTKTVITKQPDMNCQRWGEEYAISKIMFNETGVETIFI
ncbi:MAG: CMP deaminase [Bacteroidetes bacterium]|nr:CMP deaminase [Bacteroidota bacterium]